MPEHIKQLTITKMTTTAYIIIDNAKEIVVDIINGSLNEMLADAAENTYYAACAIIAPGLIGFTVGRVAEEFNYATQSLTGTDIVQHSLYGMGAGVAALSAGLSLAWTAEIVDLIHNYRENRAAAQHQDNTPTSFKSHAP